jgi:hypothetical protein
MCFHHVSLKGEIKKGRLRRGDCKREQAHLSGEERLAELVKRDCILKALHKSTSACAQQLYFKGLC